MISKPLNFSTGPLELLPQVKAAFLEEPVSHRSEEFLSLLSNLNEIFSFHLKVKKTYFLTGSGTLANEAMIGQIKSQGNKGLILSNGEFGNRLIEQASRQQLLFNELIKEPGERFSLDEIEKIFAQEEFSWILFVHCETSTGVVNPLDELSRFCKNKGIALFADCMSTIGTMQLDLSAVSLATASSGKGIGSMAGIALVFSNIHCDVNLHLPKYIDLGYADAQHGVPFTISSNQLQALYVAAKNNFNLQRWQKLDEYSKKIYYAINSIENIPWATEKSRIFTIHQKDSLFLEKGLLGGKLLVSYNSGYLVKANHLQIALLGNYTEEEINFACDVIKDLRIGSYRNKIA